MAAENSVEQKMQMLGINSTPEEFLATLPEPVQKRVETLQQLNTQHQEIEARFRKERAELEAKYEKEYAPLYDERSSIVTGRKSPSDAPSGEGIPEFWLTVFLKSGALAERIKEKDLDVLKHLVDVRSQVLIEGDAPRGFKLSFYFDENDHFTNKVLEKSYLMAVDDDGVLEKAEGTKIDWKAGKDVTIKIMKKKPKKGGKPDSKPQTKIEKVDSFFNFFSPPDVPDENEEMEMEEMEELQELIEDDFEVGSTIREKLIPHAIDWFTGDAAEEDDSFGVGDEDEDEDDDDQDGDDDDDDEDDSEDDHKKKTKGRKGAPKDGEKPPECKQQ